MWFKMKKWDVATAEKGKFSVRVEEILPCDAATAFDAFKGHNIPQWFGDITSANWISDNKEEVNALRQVNLKPMSVKERFLIWDDNKRFTFYVEAATLPLLNAMIEDCIFTDLGDNTCRFTWNVYYEPNWVAGLLAPVTRMIYNKMFTQAIRDLKHFVS